MYSIIQTNSKTKLSNFVNGVSQENFIFLLYFILIGVVVFSLTPFLVEHHEQALARDEFRKTQKNRINCAFDHSRLKIEKNVNFKH